jgi:DnaJ family protein A protein 5
LRPQKNKKAKSRQLVRVHFKKTPLLGKRKPVEKPATTQSTAGGGSTVPVESSCMICKETFPSRSKLFEHIKATGHAALKENLTATKSKKKRK